MWFYQFSKNPKNQNLHLPNRVSFKIVCFMANFHQNKLKSIYSKTPSNTAPSSTDLEVTLFRLDLKIFEQHWFFQSYTVFIFDRKPLESSFLMLESTLLKRKWGSKCYLVMVFYNEALKWTGESEIGKMRVVHERNQPKNFFFISFGAWNWS